MTFKVFISHSVHPDDTNILYTLANLLRQNGMDAYVAEWNPEYGNYLPDKIKNAINQSDVVIVILTNWSSRSAYVNQEIGYAEDRKLIIPLVEKGVEIKGFLVGKEYAEFDRMNYDTTLVNVTGFLKNMNIEKQQKEMLGNIILLGLGLLGLGALADYLSSR